MTRPATISSVRLSSVTLPLATPISDAKVLTGRQKPLTEVAMLFAEVDTRTASGASASATPSAPAGPGMYAHAEEIAPELIGEDPNDIGRLWDKLVWAGASVGRSGLATQAIAAFDVALWDMKAKRAGPAAGQAARRAPRLGALLQHLRRFPVDADRAGAGQRRRLDRRPASAASRSRSGIPTPRSTWPRVEAVREHVGDGVSR